MNSQQQLSLFLFALAFVIGGCASSSNRENSETSDRPAIASFTKDLGLQDTPWGRMRVLFPMAARTRVAPDYPREFKLPGIDAEVTVEALIGIDGVPKDVRVYQSSGHLEFDQSAVECFFRWRFPVWTENGQPAQIVTRQVIVFHIER